MVFTIEGTKKAVEATRVLLIEDDPDDRVLVTDYLVGTDRAAFGLEFAGALSAGLKRLSTGTVDAILLDLFLPDSQGYETFIRTHTHAPRVPIVILTGLNDEELGIRAVRHGAQDYLRKENLSAEVLVRAIRYAIERKQAEEQLRQSQKMEAIGQLAGGVAHDFNNLLGVILGNAEILQSCALGGEVAPRALAHICQAAKSAASLTTQLLAFSRSRAVRAIIFNPNEVIRQSGELLHHLLHKGIAIDIRTDPDLGNVHADPGQIEQIILNLAVNARDAMPQGGTLTIETQNAKLDGNYLSAPGAIQPGHYVMLSVSDTGIGMDMETQGRIFEPFFTTKSQGTGLGLATVRGIITQNDGHIEVYSEPGRGTTMKVYLPRVTKQAANDETGAPLRLTQRATETILLVEDNVDVREVSREFLATTGYTVLEAGSFDDAVAIARNHRGTIHLLLTDVMLPSGNGREIAAEVSLLRPQTAVRFMSGCAENVIAEHGALGPAIVLLQKPFTRNQLLSFVREALDTQSAKSSRQIA